MHKKAWQIIGRPKNCSRSTMPPSLNALVGSGTSCSKTLTHTIGLCPTARSSIGGAAQALPLKNSAKPNSSAIRNVSLFDRSTLSVEFATKKLTRLFPNTRFTQGDTLDAQSVLISHVLNELSNAELSRLLMRLKHATSIIWVEPSQKQIATRLVEVREALRNDFHIVAPCVHQASCGMLAPENARHWCHHVALPPQEAFTESKWAKFADALHIDLSDLSLSYLVLDKRSLKPLSPNVKRLVGNVRLYKATASVLLCDEQGVREVELTKRDLPDVFKAFKKGKIASLPSVEVESGRIKQWNTPI